MFAMSRIKRLEAMRPNRLIVLVRLQDGTEREMSAPEFAEAVKHGADFVRAVRGDDLNDARLILITIHSVID